MQILIGLVVLVLAVFGWVSDASSKSSLNREKKKKLEEKWGHRQVDRTKSLNVRNEDIISKYLQTISVGYQRSYYIENIVLCNNQTYVNLEYHSIL
jgi:Skp family chaperone for outer membrane proteins